jgi:hypothetical protein
MLSYPGPERQQAGCFVILRESSTVVAPVPGRFFGVPESPATAVNFFTPRPWPQSSGAAHSAFSVEVRDFEE